jgi:hypothetical protein
MTTYDHPMGVERITVSLDSELAGDVRAAADEDRTTVSAWVAEALQRSLNTRGLRALVREYEAEHGAFTEDELRVARERLQG